jgi:hypothetical protein
MSEFDDLLKRTEEARNEKRDINEEVNTLGNLLSIRVAGLVDENRDYLLSLNKECREKIEKMLLKKLSEAMKRLEVFEKDLEL